MYCGQATVVKHEPGQRTGKILRCRSWQCDECRDMRKRQLIAQAHGGKPDVFITLTIRVGAFPTPEDAASELARAWRLIRKRIMRRYNRKRAPFLAVMERTKKGWPHLHICWRGGWIDRQWLSDQTEELLSSPIIDIRKIDNPGRLAAYVTKYVGKDPAKIGTSKRYWQTQDYDRRPPGPDKPVLGDGEWIELRDKPLSWIVETWRQLGLTIEHLSRTKVRATEPPDWAYRPLPGPW